MTDWEREQLNRFIEEDHPEEYKVFFIDWFETLGRSYEELMAYLYESQRYNDGKKKTNYKKSAFRGVFLLTTDDTYAINSL